MPTKLPETPLHSRALRAFLPGFYLLLPCTAALSMMMADFGIRLGIAIWRIAPLSEGHLFRPLSAIAIASVCGICGVVSAVGAGQAMVDFLKALSKRPQAMRVAAVRLYPTEAKGVWDSVAKVCSRLKVRPPDHVILDFDANMFVTDRVIDTYEGTISGRTLCISAPLLRVLTVEELESVVAHEMAHFSGDDLVLSQHFYPLYHRPARALKDVQELVTESRWHDLTLLWPKVLIASYLRRFAEAEAKISRVRELRADAMAAKV